MPTVHHVLTPKVPENETSTWSNCLVIGKDIVMSGMTAHLASKEKSLGMYEQAHIVLNKILNLVEAAGGHIGNIYKLVIYVKDISYKDDVSCARRDFFKSIYPCSTLVEVSNFVFEDIVIEIDAFARLDVDIRDAINS